jgi:hypothetical protein
VGVDLLAKLSPCGFKSTPFFFRINQQQEVVKVIPADGIDLNR